MKRRMTAVEFEAVRPFIKNVSEDRQEAAKAALVDGLTLQSIADTFGWKSRQAVGDAVDIVWSAYQRHLESQRVAANAGALLPPGWEQVTLIAPSHLIAKFRAEIAESSNELMPAKTKTRRK